ncbi:MAG: amidohydrolase family protein [Planctomycetota bacterium]
MDAHDSLRLLRARAVLSDPDRYQAGGGVLIRGGTVLASGPIAALRRRAPGVVERDLGDTLITPGLVNAHAHLELGALAASTRGALQFERWVEALVGARRAADPSALLSERDAGARRLLETGTTTVGDIDSLGLAPLSFGPRRVVQRELLDARDPGRREAALGQFAAPPTLGALEHEGVSPHAPFSVSHALLEAIAPRVERERIPVAMHWAETPEEVAWCDGAEAWFDRYFPREPHLHGLDALEHAGLLGARTALIHGNHPRPDEPRRVAEAGATVVHCPGCHTWFERGPFPLREYVEAGCHLALGTDSLASNDDLDLRRELTLAVGRGAWTPRQAWTAATLGGARAVGLEGRVGRLESGFWADLSVFEDPPETLAGILEWLVESRPNLHSVWVAGQPAVGSEPV